MLKGAQGQQPEKRYPRIAAGPDYLHHRRVRLGKSTLINDTLATIAARELNGASEEPPPYDDIRGPGAARQSDECRPVPIGRTRAPTRPPTPACSPRSASSSPACPMARERGYSAGRFSFNVKGGRCEACQGDGVIKVEMHFLPDVYVPCEVCHGKRYNPRNPGSAIQRQKHQPSAGHDRRGRPGILRRRAHA